MSIMQFHQVDGGLIALQDGAIIGVEDRDGYAVIHIANAAFAVLETYEQVLDVSKVLKFNDGLWVSDEESSPRPAPAVELRPPSRHEDAKQALRDILEARSAARETD